MYNQKQYKFITLLTWGIEGSLNLSALSNFVPLIVFGAGLFGSYVPGGGAQPTIL